MTTEPIHMTAADLKRIRKKIGLNIRGLAEQLRYNDHRGLRRMEDGEKPITGPISLLLDMMDRGEFPDRLRVTFSEDDRVTCSHCGNAFNPSGGMITDEFRLCPACDARD